ncbi:hypothetical protein ACP70R_010705 [Stipagrostis hirtigluma subsp. patula]
MEKCSCPSWSGAQEEQQQQTTTTTTTTTWLKIRRRRFRFCRRDEFGTRSHRGGRRMDRPTPLGREIILRTELRIITAKYYGIEGIHEWEAYKQRLPAIKALLAAIDAALRRYKARRVERGLFHLVPRASSVSFWILSPLRAPPGDRRREALERWRRQREKRKAIAAAAAAERPTDQGRAVLPASLGEMKARLMQPSTALYIAYLVSVSVLSCMIVYL